MESNVHESEVKSKGAWTMKCEIRTQLEIENIRELIAINGGDERVMIKKVCCNVWKETKERTESWVIWDLDAGDWRALGRSENAGDLGLARNDTSMLPLWPETKLRTYTLCFFILEEVTIGVFCIETFWCKKGKSSKSRKQIGGVLPLCCGD